MRTGSTRFPNICSRQSRQTSLIFFPEKLHTDTALVTLTTTNWNVSQLCETCELSVTHWKLIELVTCVNLQCHHWKFGGCSLDHKLCTCLMRQDKVRHQNKKMSLAWWLSENQGGASKSKATWFDAPVPVCDKFDYSLTVDSWTFSETSEVSVSHWNFTGFTESSAR